MSLHKEWRIVVLVILLFLLCYMLPVEELRASKRLAAAIWEALFLVRWYAREHVLLCLIPAFFIAGAISVFVNQGAVMKYLGAGASKVLAYGVASVSGTILAVCSCTVLPLFAGIYRMGAGLGPACAFLYSGPAINVLAIILTARILGWELGVARALGAILFSILIGLGMHLLFRKEERAKAAQAVMPEEEPRRSLRQNALYFACMVAILVFANWARSGDIRAVFLCCPGGLRTLRIEGRIASETKTSVVLVDNAGTKHAMPREQLRELKPIDSKSLQKRVHEARWWIVAAFGLALLYMLRQWFTRQELHTWVGSSWGYAKQILPLLLGGVLIAGLLLGRAGEEGLIPNRWVQILVGSTPDGLVTALGLGDGVFTGIVVHGWSLWTNLFAAVIGAFMYFATLTEVPILQGLLGNGMGRGPALALLLAGPALSLPNMLVIQSVIGTQKTIAFVTLVVLMAAASGMVFGAIAS